MDKGSWNHLVSPAELEHVNQAGRKLLSLRVTLLPDCEQRLMRFRLIDAKLCAYEQVLARIPELTDPAESQASIESVTWLLAVAGESEHLRRWVQLMLDVDQVDVAEMNI
ncbi:hypothetical protein [Paenibacillus phocaensis]|uniref:hypothetical protein n=1 Tax=Paenibacillus phocaensis TaxID=1776378 RepID=UPI00039A92BF|nr:hypothetical protein [Paenibacillus phocaensis]